jgi:hypothetical protein
VPYFFLKKCHYRRPGAALSNALVEPVDSPS